MTENTREPFGDPTTAPYWEAAQTRRFVLQKCDDCGHFQFYPRPFCLECESRSVSWKDASGTGKVYSMSEVHMSPSPDIEAPYIVAMVELDEGPRFMTNIVNGPCEIDDRVQLVWRERDGKPPVPDFESLGPAGNGTR